MSRSVCAIDKDVVPASFKGILFYCTDADAEGGRRGAEGEFPFGEDTAYADLGRKIRVFHLTAYFREDDHVWDAEALFQVCQSPGPGLLVHPTRGTHMVACRSIKVSDKLEESAGETTAEMEFVEANIGFGPGLIGSIFGIIATGLFAASQASFLRDYTPALVPMPWKVDVVDKAQGLIWQVAKVSEHVVASGNPESDWRAIFRMWEVAKDDGLALQAPVVDDALVSGFSLISRNVQDPKNKFNLFRRLANTATTATGLPPGPATESDEAVVSRHRILSAIGMAEAAMGRKYVTVDEALTAKDTVVAVLDDEAKAAYAECDNALYLEIVKYATNFSKMMYDLSYRLPGQVHVNFSGGVHPLVASYAIYKDAKRHRELEERNLVDANGRFGPIVVGVSPV
jgi:Mu-like prophage DNA circulation protein